MNDNYFNNIYNNLNMSSTLLFKPTLPTSHSLTSITIPTIKNKSLDPILTNLQNRKKQLMETLQRKDIKSPQQQEGENKKKKRQDNKYSISQIDENKQKKRKYEMKIEKQRQECEKIKTDVSSVQNEMLRCVADRQDCEVRIKRISEQVGIKYRHAFGIEQAHCQQSRKWIYHKILELQQKIENSPLNMRKLMCKIYSQETAKTDIIENKIPAQSIFQYIVKMRLVNKLYGVILASKIQRKQQNKKKQYQQLLGFSIRSRSSISDNYSQIDSSYISQSDEGEEEEVVNLEDEQSIVHADQDDDWYLTWVSILKLMKRLQKMQPILPMSNQQLDQKGRPQANIVQLKKQIKLLLQQQRRQKIKIREKQKLIKQLKNKKIQLDQDLKIKQEYIEQLKQKIDKYQAIIIKYNSKSNNQNECFNADNAQKEDGNNTSKEHRQLRQVEEAINYFTIKKNTYTPVAREVEKQTNDISVTTMLSPIKSTIRNEIMTSPYLNSNSNSNSNIKSTIKRSNKKYSLKDLLSPSKSYMVGDKKKAWK